MLTNQGSPKPYLVIGNGKMAKHWMHYLSLKGIVFDHWHRKGAEDLGKLLSSNSYKVIFVLISDSAIPSFFEQHLKNCKVPLVHFSGAHNFTGLIDLHPVMTFGPDLYELDVYQSLSFVSASIHSVKELLPELSTNHLVHQISPEQKAKYHALCVIVSNLPTLLWQNAKTEFEHLQIPVQTWNSLVKQSLANFLKSPEQSLTGPIVRRDIDTIRKNIDSLADSPKLQAVYQTFAQQFLDTNIASQPTKESP